MSQISTPVNDDIASPDVSDLWVRSNRPNFDRQLRIIQRDVLRMGALVELSCWLACQSLFARDLAAAQQIKANEKQIDFLYRQIEVDCVNVLALQSPVSRDLRLLSALMQLIRDLERIGDYAEDLGEVAVKLFSYPQHDCLPQIQIMADRCRSMVALSLACLSNLDSQAGLDLKARDDLVDNDYEAIYTALIAQTDVGGALEPTILLSLAIRYLERMADHATNIGRRVAYVVTGER